MTRFLTLDPGGTTGYCTLDYFGNKDYDVMFGQLANANHHRDVYSLVQQSDYVVSEGFEYRNSARAGLVLDSKEYIGVAKLGCELFNHIYVEQSAAQAKGFVPDSILKKAGWYRAGNKHAMDAARHMIYFLVNGKHNEKELRTLIIKSCFG